MGPWIILDKSVMQGLSQLAIFELGRYFTGTIPDVLLLETLADLSLDPDDPAASASTVTRMANKALPFNSFPNIDYRQLCAQNLLGYPIQMSGVAHIAAQNATTADGRVVSYSGITPQNEAILRWQEGFFSEADIRFAHQWRRDIEFFNLESMKKSAPKMDVKLRTPEKVKSFTDSMLANPTMQFRHLETLLHMLTLGEDVNRMIMARWMLSDRKTLASFAPYAAHCLRVRAMFIVGMCHNVFGTKPSNLIDLQYLFYAPFCMIFSSNDKLLIDLAPLVLRPNQSFVGFQELKTALDTVAQRRKESIASGQEDANPVEPDDQSLIQALWKKHAGKFKPQAVRQTFTTEHIAEVNALLKPLNEAVEAAERNRPPNKIYPHEQ